MLKQLVLVALLSMSMLFIPWTVGAQPIEIEVGMAETWQPAGLDYMQNVLIPAFEAENPDIKVSMTQIGWSMDTYVTRFVAGEAPDVLQIGGDRVGTYVDMITPLNNYVQGWDVLSDFPQSILDGATVNGRLYGIPWSMPIWSLKYRVDHFLEAGLDPNSPPETWDDIVDYGRRLVRIDPQNNMIRQAIELEAHWLQFANWLYQAGGEYMNPDRNRVTFGSDAAQEAAAFLRSLIQEYAISDPTGDLAGLDRGEASIELRQGTILNVPEFRDIVQIAPPLSHREQTQVAYGNQWVITNTSPHQDAAWKFIEFASRIENLVGYTQNAQIIPPRVAAVNYEPWSNDPRFMTLFANTALSKHLPFDSRHIDHIRREWIQPALEAVLYKGAPVTELVEAERLANAWLEDQGL